MLIQAIFEFFFCPKHGVLARPGGITCLLGVPVAVRLFVVKVKNLRHRRPRSHE